MTAMQRTIVTIGHHDGKLTARLDKAGSRLLGAKDPELIGYTAETLPPIDTPGNLDEYAAALTKGLMKHKAIEQVLQNIFVAAPGSQHALYFEIEAPAGEQIRWESLCDANGGFLALGGGCHIGRIAEEASSRESGVRAFNPPLRLAAFLSGIGLQAQAEWDALRTAIDNAAGDGLPVRAQVYIGEPELLEACLTDYGHGMHDVVEVLPMPASTAELENLLNRSHPHVVHFFCHGSVGMGAAFLQLATVAEHALAKPQGSVVLSVDEMVNLPGLQESWLMVLNCCQGAHAEEQLNSMAYRIVSRGGVAAAIGMQEPVAVGEASAFCASLYPQLFHAFTAALTMEAGAAPVTVNLSQAMSAPRRALRNMYLGQEPNSRWTLPVLYLQDRPLEICRPVVVDLSQDMLSRIAEKVNIIAGFLRSLPPDTPGLVRDLCLATLDQPPVVPPEMRPDRFGNVGAQRAALEPASD
jgi:hypothetical protein